MRVRLAARRGLAPASLSFGTGILGDKERAAFGSPLPYDAPPLFPRDCNGGFGFAITALPASNRYAHPYRQYDQRSAPGGPFCT